MESPGNLAGSEILILDGEHPNTLPVVQSLGEAGYRLSLAGTSFSGPAFMSRYPARVSLYPDPLQNRAAFQEWILQELKTGRSAILFPVTDKTVHPLMEASLQQRLPPQPFLPDPLQFERLFDKRHALDIARRCGTPLPRSVILSSTDDLSLSEGLRYPFYGKPVSTKIWKGLAGFDLSTRLIHDRGQLSDWVAKTTRFCPVILQEKVPGLVVGIGVLCDRGEIILELADRSLHELPLTEGGSSYRVSVPVPDHLRSCAKKLLGQIGWHGLAMLKFRCDGERFWLTGIDGGIWGSMALAISAGMDFPRWHANLVLHKARPPATLSPKMGLYQRKLLRDLIWFWENLNADRKDKNLPYRPTLISVLEGLRLLWGKERWDCLRVSDPRPFLHELQGMGKFLQKKLLPRSLFKKERVRSRRLLLERLPKKILLLCYGNICRSPYAEHRLRTILASGPFEIRSAGFYPDPDHSPPPSYLALVSERGIDLEGHRSTLVDTKLTEWADLIVIMDRVNWRQLRSLRGENEEKTVWLGAWGEEGADVEIEDPYGKAPEKVEEILNRMDRACDGFAEVIEALSCKPAPPGSRKNPLYPEKRRPASQPRDHKDKATVAAP
ncbi:MAG: arsenate reductase/protein-tyrosine-phosphatase family protein [Leptospirales bacterium]